MITKCLNMKGKEFYTGAIMNDGAEAVLCGNSVKVFDCNKHKYLQTISRMNNAYAVIAHNQRKMCLINASENDYITVKEFVLINGQWSEKNSIKMNGTNLDGGKPQFSNDDQYLFFF